MVTFNPDTVTMQDAKTGAIPRNISDSIITEVQRASSAMQLAKQVPMTKPIEEFNYMTGIGAYWVNEAERIQTSKPTFVKAEMRAHKLAVIVPTTKENIKFSITNFFALMKPEVQTAFNKKFDQAALVGEGGSPYPKNVVSSARIAGNVVEETANKYDDINEAISLIEDEDLEPNGIATVRRQKRKYRATKDGNDLPIFNTANSNGVDDLLGLPVAYMPKDAVGADIAEIVGDWDYAYYGILDGIEYEVLTEATLSTVQDENGNDLNLAERDMVALKVTMHIGFMVVKDEAFSVVDTVEEVPAG